ncbi:hypothetical protein SAMD00019534_089050 [Acytostelium subglobosum LB1]|uniref:hypothetical protein n=1 Tax=Acytostelium subglobosum LB1 TaxID=1410327 RepID=UPI000644ED31|nr:hypothetical protein SAMD00019534_089050 [Acytostelium subglobosum LB1]GAM25730.1 hypothetical protein SAMD00019534_089050 [Acytostelium subglobosum LB1]|eukprot:XP_012751248.1 hypothetical protein SAMD00019534_089050 [Acytostelium subglobosum LB1]
MAFRNIATRLVAPSSSSLQQGVRHYTVGTNVFKTCPEGLTFIDQANRKHPIKDIFSNKNVVVVGCTGLHPVDQFQLIPSYVKNADKIYSKGVDYIVSLSTLDAPMLKANRISLDPKIRLTHLCDENAEFAEANKLCEDINMESLGVMDASVRRYKRFVLIVNNGNIVYESAESNPDDCSHTDATAVLAHL